MITQPEVASARFWPHFSPVIMGHAQLPATTLALLSFGFAGLCQTSWRQPHTPAPSLLAASDPSHGTQASNLPAGTPPSIPGQDHLSFLPSLAQGRQVGTGGWAAPTAAPLPWREAGSSCSPMGTPTAKRGHGNTPRVVGWEGEPAQRGTCSP